MRKNKLKQWIHDVWNSMVGYFPRFGLLSNHWIIFDFMFEYDLIKILEIMWVIGRGVLMLKRWVPWFNPYMYSFKKRCLWMLLPNFPKELWVLKVFKNIGDMVGRFVYFDEQSLRCNNKTLASVLVEMDLDLGLP